MTGERNINRKKVNPLKAGRIKKRVRKLNQKKEAEKRVPLRMEDMTKKQRREQVKKKQKKEKKLRKAALKEQKESGIEEELQ